jgi:hypothetical protein
VLKKTLATGAVAAASAGILFTGTPAFADDNVAVSGHGSAFAGNHSYIDAETENEGCGNATANAGHAEAGCFINTGVIVVDN